MTQTEIFNRATYGGGDDLSAMVEICKKTGNFCLIGGLAINCYVDPVFTADADIVMVTSKIDKLKENILKTGTFEIEEFSHSINARMPESDLIIQFTTDPRYQDFVKRATERDVLRVKMPVAALEDIVQGKIWAWQDNERRISKRAKDQADLIRIAEKYPEMLKIMPGEIQQIIQTNSLSNTTKRKQGFRL